MIQLLMDRSSTNMKVLKLLEKKHNEKESDPLIKIGSSGSHNVCDAFQAGGETTTWDLEKIMKAL